jgi:hypothetical protein
MKYVQPYGISDPDAHYINGDPSQARQGSIPPAAAFENPMREIVAVISKSIITPEENDLAQMAKGVRSQRMNYAEDSGSVNSLSVAYDPPMTSYTVGLPLRVKVKNTITGPATIDAGAGRVQIKKPGGAQLAANDFYAGDIVELVYDGTNFQAINFGGTGTGGGGSTVYYINVPYTVDSSPTPNLITANFSPAVTGSQLVAGFICMVKAANTNTGPTTINVQSLGAKQVYALGGGDLLPSDICAGDILILSYDGTRFYVAPNVSITQNVTLNVPSSQFATPAAVFSALGRKRIPPNVTVTIQLGTGVFSPISTYHVDANRIVMQGTMLAAAPGQADFAKTGNSSAARAADSATNIAMLRARFGTEIHFTNAQLCGLQHTGPGRITYKQLLITGENVYASSNAGQVAGINPPRGGNIYCDTVCVWGSGSFGYVAIESSLDATNSYACGCFTDGWCCSTNASMVLDTCGSYGNAWSGYESATGSQIYFFRLCQGQMNGTYGAIAGQLGGMLVGSSAFTGNATLDVYAFDLSEVNATGSTWGTSSPATNGGPGNNGSLVKAG